MVDPFWLDGVSGDTPHELPDGIKDSEFVELLEKHVVLGDDAWLARGFICRDGSQLSPVGLAALNHPPGTKVASKMSSLRIAQFRSLTPESLQPWGSMAKQLRVLEFPDGVDLDSRYIRNLSRFPALEAIAFDCFNMQESSVYTLIDSLRSISRLCELALPRCMLQAAEICSLLNKCCLSRLVVSSQLISRDDQEAIRESYEFCSIRWE